MLANLLGKNTHQETISIERQDGDTFQGRLTPFSAKGKPYALVRITDEGCLHRTESDLVNATKRYEAIFSNATIGIVVFNQEGQLVTANRKAEQKFGYADGEMPGRTIGELLTGSLDLCHEELRRSEDRNRTVNAMGDSHELNAK